MESEREDCLFLPLDKDGNNIAHLAAESDNTVIFKVRVVIIVFVTVPLCVCTGNYSKDPKARRVQSSSQKKQGRTDTTRSCYHEWKCAVCFHLSHLHTYNRTQ